MLLHANTRNRTCTCLLATALLYMLIAGETYCSANQISSLGQGLLWQMKQRDMQHTGRADFTVPVERLNNAFFDVFLWQTPSPGSPHEGGLSSTQMTFRQGAGPGGSNIVVGGYHWPKGVQGMDMHDGRVFWNGNPRGGETIGTATPAFSNDGSTLYVVNDATQSDEFPDGHPLMAFSPSVGPSTYRHNGNDANPRQLAMDSPTIGPDGRIFLHAWVDRPYAGTDDGAQILTTWSAAANADCGRSDPTLYPDGSQLKVIIGARYGAVVCYDGSGGAELWRVQVPAGVDSGVTIDPANGNIYVGAGLDGDTYVVGLTRNGSPLWGTSSKMVYDWINGVNNRHRAQSAGCLSHDGSTYYFQTNSQQGDGKLYAINTTDGSVKWSFETGSRGWEIMSSSPIVTENGVVVVGNNEGDTYFAIKDEGSEGVLIDSLQVDEAGNARASASISADGVLYLPLRTIWSAPNGDSAPNYQVGNLFTAIDLSRDATVVLPPPPNQSAVALNHSVLLSWRPVQDNSGSFEHYAVYRDTKSFTSVEGMVPIATVPLIGSTGHLDSTAENGTSYWYAITTVSAGGAEMKEIEGIGPRTPRDETDLQVVSVARTPRYPRYAAVYTWWEITEPSGFGPYGFSSSTGLEHGQDENTQRWPNVGDPATYTATVRNRGTNPWNGELSSVWRVDGQVVSEPTKTVTLDPGGTTTFAWVMNWDGQSHEIEFTVDVADARTENNSLATDTKSVAFLTYADKTKIEEFRENTLLHYSGAETDDLFDWLNRHMVRFNELFAEGGCAKRVHYGILEALDDGDPDPEIDRIDFAIFPFRYRTGEGDPRLSGYYRPNDDIDYGLLHEMGHQLGMIDIYQLDVPAEANLVSGIGYSAVRDLMLGCDPVISEFSALTMNHWLDKAHGYYGQFLYNLPEQIRLRLLGFDGEPLTNADVTMYQYCERPGMGKVITDQVKAHGQTDSEGYFTLPNVPIDPAKVPPVHTGDTLRANPFGYVAVVGTNGVFHFKVEKSGGVDYCWLDITEAVVACLKGETSLATFDRQVSLGGSVQYFPPDDMAELNSNDWLAWAEGVSPANTFVEDDTERTIVGSGSIKFTTDGGFDTCVRYPRTFTAQWDLRTASALEVSFYALNPNGFQEGSPWIRLRDAQGNYAQYQYFINGWPHDLLNDVRGVWRSYSIPLDASPTEEHGWRRTDSGTPDMSRINAMEIHADTWGYGFMLWLDGVRFVFPGGLARSISDARFLPDNSRVEIRGASVTAAWPGVFYIESPDRSSGIRAALSDHQVSVGDEVDVAGFVTTNADEERMIDASLAQVIGRRSVEPLFMKNLYIGGAGHRYDGEVGTGQKGVQGGVGLNNIGLLVKVFGACQYVDSHTFILDDGSGPVTCVVPNGAVVDPDWAYLLVTGISSCEKLDGQIRKRILIRDGDDIVPYQ